MTRKNSLRCPYLVRFAYRGDRFFGVQEQRALPTVLGALRERIEDAAQQSAHALVAAARTDKGVSALVNFASFYLRPPIDHGAFIARASRDRDDGLFTVVFARASTKTHARGNGSLKTYRYTIRDDRQHPREIGNFFWEIAPRLSLAAMRFAALDFLGEQDFSSVRGGGCEARTAIKKITSIAIARTARGYIIIDIEGYGFLRNMVRNMVGLFVEIGAGLRQCDAAVGILKEQSREKAGIMAPAHGLMLHGITMLERRQGANF
jgi:tRNA pseudouridine38-40 synthase